MSGQARHRIGKTVVAGQGNVDAVNSLVHADLRLTASLTQNVYRLVFNYYNDEGTGLGTFYRFYF